MCFVIWKYSLPLLPSHPPSPPPVAFLMLVIILDFPFCSPYRLFKLLKGFLGSPVGCCLFCWVCVRGLVREGGCSCGGLSLNKMCNFVEWFNCLSKLWKKLEGTPLVLKAKFKKVRCTNLKSYYRWVRSKYPPPSWFFWLLTRGGIYGVFQKRGFFKYFKKRSLQIGS